MSDQDVKANVQERYGKAALSVLQGAKAGCGCGCDCGTENSEVWDTVTADLYDQNQLQDIPQEAFLACTSLPRDNGCKLWILWSGRRGSNPPRDGVFEDPTNART